MFAGEGSTTKLAWVVGGIHFLAAVGLQVLFSCWLRAPSASRGYPEFLLCEIPPPHGCLLPHSQQERERGRCYHFCNVIT